MGNFVTKIRTDSVELNESNVSDIVVYEKELNQVKKDNKSPNTSTQAKPGLFKNALFGSLDPRSPSLFITRTPIQILRSVGSSSKFNHKELLNESLNESVDIDILTAEEEESLNSNKDLVDAVKQDEAIEKIESSKEDTLPDPRSPTTEINRTRILAINDDQRKTDDNNLIKKITDKLISTKLSNETNFNGQKTTTDAPTKKKGQKPITEKKLIYEDEHENFDRFSTPPKKLNGQNTGNDRTPLSCLANKDRSFQPRALVTSTPKGSKIPVLRERPSSRISQK